MVICSAQMPYYSSQFGSLALTSWDWGFCLPTSCFKPTRTGSQSTWAPSKCKEWWLQKSSTSLKQLACSCLRVIRWLWMPRCGWSSMTLFGCPTWIHGMLTINWFLFDLSCNWKIIIQWSAQVMGYYLTVHILIAFVLYFQTFQLWWDACSFLYSCSSSVLVSSTCSSYVKLLLVCFWPGQSSGQNNNLCEFVDIVDVISVVWLLCHVSNLFPLDSRWESYYLWPSAPVAFDRNIHSCYILFISIKC